MINIFLSLSLILFSLSLIFVSVRDRFGYLPVFFSLYFICILIIPAYFHIYNNVFPFYNLSYDYDDQLSAAIILFIFTIFFWLSFFLTPISRVVKDNYITKHVNKYRYMSTIWIVLILLSFGLLSYGINTFMTPRGEFSTESLGENATTRELVLSFLRAGAFFSVYFLLIYKKMIGKVYWYFTFLWALSLFFIFNYPLALSRFLFFSYLIILFCYYVKVSKISKISVILIFSIGVTTLFPFFSYITRGEGDFLKSLNGYYQSSGDFDGFQSIINAVIYTSKFGFTFGIQILSSIFSFVPRSLWIDKAQPTGSITASAAGYDFLNISSPLPSEFFIDFGYPGLIFFSILLGVILRKIDSVILFERKLSLKFSLSIILISLLPVLSRGSLLAVINILYAEIIVFSLIYLMIFLKVKIR
ncbi:O-antigen polymerase [uncultured Acinetobacter sp.]|uniref:O-antigen polymerase n=1 Tax=uncultured Acinetobacter sp. TaxID=165433 RepID=UPI0025857418|nr:O-antigen polymerase [uncultured Acinetobacter sp.]